MSFAISGVVIPQLKLGNISNNDSKPNELPQGVRNRPQAMSFFNVQDLKETLNEFNITFDKDWVYGKLYEEIKEGESILSITQANTIRRQVSVANVYVFAKDETNTLYQLVESKQVSKSIDIFGDEGPVIQIRERNHRFIAEKMKRDDQEDFLKTAIRGIKEELGLNCAPEDLIPLTTEKQNQYANSSYPGLESEYTIYNSKLVLSKEVYNQHKEGFVEKDIKAEGTIVQYSYFVWDRATLV